MPTPEVKILVAGIDLEEPGRNWTSRPSIHVDFDATYLAPTSPTALSSSACARQRADVPEIAMDVDDAEEPRRRMETTTSTGTRPVASAV